LGAFPIPLDYLPVDTVDISDHCPNMFWRSGQDILAGAELVREDPRLHAIYVTNFNCGPDSFIISYFRRRMQGKPFLELELDDHTADTGIETRCEAFLESLQARSWAL
jgi:predicted nucleotide-binding protein (sugar kinase/HSP70/actin superfamily)